MNSSFVLIRRGIEFTTNGSQSQSKSWSLSPKYTRCRISKCSLTKFITTLLLSARGRKHFKLSFSILCTHEFSLFTLNHIHTSQNIFGTALCFSVQLTQVYENMLIYIHTHLLSTKKQYLCPSTIKMNECTSSLSSTISINTFLFGNRCSLFLYAAEVQPLPLQLILEHKQNKNKIFNKFQNRWLRSYNFCNRQCVVIK